MLTNDGLLGDRIVEFPTFVSWRVSNKHTLLHVRSQSFAFILLNMHICPNAQVVDVRLLLECDLMGCSILDGRSTTAIASMHKCKDSFTPELRGKSRFIQHCSNTFTQVPVSPLSHTILLRSVPDSVLTFNASSITEV